METQIFVEKVPSLKIIPRFFIIFSPWRVLFYDIVKVMMYTCICYIIVIKNMYEITEHGIK